ncbi:hypothetical protein [Frankia nepalensis]|uniref:Resolvase/invertase-type recombinase catalytic domain-containing protein n=2 Tax=Frankia nepalensis TaxID=1836974 RepID=A0A937RTN4_9ACTN|nr:hypothetical protein [Frankia nepalensis]MBL7499777.1 hypothetical protein [Frankia nepalensis]MBL7512262.1 hypothetical protein [Frankia nepalensis]MBL7632588.1 hypothetical protein [Frankia nepalensis]
MTLPAAPPARPRRAVGYVCVSDDEDLVNGLHQRLAGHARRTGLDLTEVYVDRPVSIDDLDRPGLALVIDEIAHHPEALLLVPDLSHLPTTATGWAELHERFTTVVTEIRALDAHPAGSSALSMGIAVSGPTAETGPAPTTSVGRARLTAQGLFEVTVLPDDDVASVVAALRQLPGAARFLEALGDVETTFVFVAASPSTGGHELLGDPVPFARVVSTGPVGGELVGLTAGDLADRLRAALDGMSLGPQDEHVLTWLATQTADRALTISSLLRRARGHAA